MKKRTTKRTRETALPMYISSRGEIVIGRYELNLEQANEMLLWLGEAVKFLTQVEIKEAEAKANV